MKDMNRLLQPCKERAFQCHSERTVSQDFQGKRWDGAGDNTTAR